MQEIIVDKNEAGQKLTKLLMKYLDKAPSSFIYKMLRKKNIKINGVRAKGDELLNINDVIKIYLSDDTIYEFQSSKGYEPKTPNKDFTLDVVYEDDNILIANKPIGVLSQKAEADDYSINEAFIDYLVEKGEISLNQLKTFKPSICNRLDRNTSGLIICGKTLVGSREINRIIKNRLIDKYYYTIAIGEISRVIDSRCYHIKVNNKVQIFDEKPEGINTTLIHTIFEPVKTSKGYTLMKVQLITGKTHQIRAQAAHLGIPLIGDMKYKKNSKSEVTAGIKRLKHQLLHCESLYFHDIEGALSYLNGKRIVCKKPKLFCDIEKEIFG